MKHKRSDLSIIGNGTTYNEGDASTSVSPPMSPVSLYQKNDRRYSTDLSPTEKRLFPGQGKQKTKFQRCRKQLNVYLHTHIALILVSVLSSLDAICVIGQVICDILIMSDKLSDYDNLHTRATGLLVNVLPSYFDNTTDYSSWSFESVIDHIEERYNSANNSATVIHQHKHLLSMTDGAPLLSRLRRSSGGPSPRAGGGGDGHEEHDLLHELTHSFHIGSMVILSVLLAETFLKIFAMGKHFLHHKLEVFDAFVITVSWTLDVAFWEGIWARPGQEGATLLIFILPWRVIRIVNSFVLVIQEKDLVLLKVNKQRLRLALRREKDSVAKLDKYRLEVRQLQGLCRKHGADENAIQACCPTGRRRRSSLFQSLTSLASVALVSAMGSTPNMDKDAVSASSSSDSEDDQRDMDVTVKVKNGNIARMDSEDSGAVSFSIGPDSGPSSAGGGKTNQAFQYDELSADSLNHTLERRLSTKL